jgi:hypothetical protein
LNHRATQQVFLRLWCHPQAFVENQIVMRSTIQTHMAKPRAWLPHELGRDFSWVHHLSREAVDNIEEALQHAKATQKSWLEMTANDFPLKRHAKQAIDQAFAATQTGYGMCLLKGFPVDRWSVEDARLAHWGIGLNVGVARTQNRASQVMNDVRDEGGSYKVKNGRGYNTNAGLDFHVDSCDVVALLCLQTAKLGGTSKVTSSIAVVDEVKRLRPDLISVMQEPFYYSYQGTNDATQPPFYKCPILGDDPEFFSLRANRKNVTAAQVDFPEVPRLTQKQIELLDLLDELLPDDKFCFSMQLDRGDMQLLNNYVVIHSRTNFEDHDEPSLKRHLLRLWLSIPQGQRLPPLWKEYFGDIEAGSVRGGVKGSQISNEFLAYELRQAKHLGMKLLQKQ